jgi:hypothetical protein
MMRMHMQVFPCRVPSALRSNVFTPFRFRGNRVFITNVKGTFLGMSESEEASKKRFSVIEGPQKKIGLHMPRAHLPCFLRSDASLDLAKSLVEGSIRSKESCLCRRCRRELRAAMPPRHASQRTAPAAQVARGEVGRPVLLGSDRGSGSGKCDNLGILISDEGSRTVRRLCRARVVLDTAGAVPG